MQISREQLNPTTVRLTISVDGDLIQEAKQQTLRRLGRDMKLAGFRPGKAPVGIVERHADANTLQSEVLQEAMNAAYGKALEQEKLRPVDQPKVTLTKFVPYTALEFAAEIPVIGEITLPDYTQFRLAKKAVKVTEKDIDEVIDNLRTRAAEKVDVERAAKNGDEVVIDFKGTDEKTKEAVLGADGKDYPLVLGSDTFIPGFESNLVGLKVGEEKTFVLEFPKDYGVKALQSRKVSFAVTVKKVHEVVKPKADDAFAAKAGPFDSVEKLRKDIEKHLESEKQNEIDRQYQNDLVDKLADGTKVAVPDVLIDEEVQRTEDDIRRNLAYRGQTWQEYLDQEGQDEAGYRKTLREPAEKRVRAGLALTEVAQREGITVTPEEFNIRMQLLKGQYTDAEMQKELAKPANARSILSAMLTEKTVARLADIAAQGEKTKPSKTK
jgi:trigger factor